MDPNNSYSSSRLILRSLLPSLVSVSGGILASIILLAIHILFFSLSLGSFSPALSNNLWIETYTGYIIRPVEIIIHNATLNTVLTAAIWGIVGLIIYTVLEASINAYNEWRTDEEEVHVVDSQKVELHPLRRWLVTRALWRLLIGICVVLLIVITSLFTHNLLVSLDNALRGTSWLEIVWRVGITIAVWALVIHCFVVLLRLFMFRTRVMGELIR